MNRRKLYLIAMLFATLGFVSCEEKEVLTCPTGVENGYEWVDLGLPSGLKWANYNIGATKPEESGLLFAWGETSSKEMFDWEGYKYCDVEFAIAKDSIEEISNPLWCGINKYHVDDGVYSSSSIPGFGEKDKTKQIYWYKQIKSGGDEFKFTGDSITVLDPEDDAAIANMGENWRIPTVEEMEELRVECTWEWTERNGVKGYKVKGKNGNFIFLPAIGFKMGGEMVDAGKGGYYWSNSLSGKTKFASSFYFCSDRRSASTEADRCNGRPIRAVCP